MTCHNIFQIHCSFQVILISETICLPETGASYPFYTTFKEEGVYRSHCVGLSVCRSVGRKPYFVRPISYKPLGGIE